MQQRPIRPEVERGLIILAIHDPRFVEGVRDDLEGTLYRYGYSLFPEELEAARRFHRAHIGMENEEIVRLLESGSDPQIR